MSIYSRREFIKLTGITVASTSSGLIFLTPTAEAAWPLVLRILFQAGVRRAAARAAAKTVGGSVARHGVAAASRSTFKKVAEIGLTTAVAFLVSPKVYVQAREYNAETIWINEGYDNRFDIELQNNSSERKQANLWYQLVDVNNHQIEIKKNCGLLSTGPRDKFSFSFGISDLPYTGVKRLEALSDSADLKKYRSGNIVVADSSEVMFDES